MARSTDHTDSLGVRVVEAVAAARDVSVEGLSPLYYTIEPDALDTLFPSTGDGVESTGCVRFQYEGCTVVVTSDGTVEAAVDDDRTVHAACD